MAIDSAEKRACAFVDVCGVLVPDGVVSRFDKATLLGQYCGIIASFDVYYYELDLYVKRAASHIFSVARDFVRDLYVKRTKALDLER